MSLDTLLWIMVWVAILFMASAVFGLSRRVLSIQLATSAAQAIVPAKVNIGVTDIQLGGYSAAVFVSPGCIACHDRIAELRQRNAPSNLALVAEEELGPLAQGLPVIQASSGSFVAAGVRLTPFGLVVLNGLSEWEGPLANDEAMEAFLKVARRAEVGEATAGKERGNV